MRSFLIRCYPARWRARYGEEFAAVLEDGSLGPFEVADILLGALDARLRLRGLGATSHTGKGFTMSLRIGGIAAIVGGVLWAFGLLGASEVLGRLGTAGTTILLLAGTASMLVALAGLSAFQARKHPFLAWVAFLVPAAGMVAIVVAFSEVLGDLSWTLLNLGGVIAWAGFVVFAVVTYLTAVLSRGAAGLVGAAIVIPVVLALAAGAIGLELGPTVGFALFVIAATGFLLGWFALGVGAIRMDGLATAERRG
jgi:hypothetical protein